MGYFINVIISTMHPNIILVMGGSTNIIVANGFNALVGNSAIKTSYVFLVGGERYDT